MNQNQITIPIGESAPNAYLRGLRHNLNQLLSMALSANALDLDINETEALRGVSDFMLMLHHLESLDQTEGS
ncbi:MAG: hypothetical protein AAGN35_16325 [Bacteroidota bacterium]